MLFCLNRGTGSTPVSTAFRSRGPEATTPASHAGNHGSSPCGITDLGAHVPRGRGCLASSLRWVQLPSSPLKLGLSSKGKIPAWRAGDPGSTPGRSTDTEGSRITVGRAILERWFSIWRGGFNSLTFRCYPDGEMDIISRLERDVAGSTPARGAFSSRRSAARTTL